LTATQKKYHITQLEALAFIWSLGHFHTYLCTRPFLWKTDHRALKYIFDTSKSYVSVLARYKLIADEYRFSPIWISGSTMVADVFSRLCIVPTGKTAMTNREMVMADLNYLIDIVDSNAQQHRRAVIADFLFAKGNDDEDEEKGEEQEADLGAIDENEFNPEHQPLHPDKDMICGKLAINVPAFTASDLYQIRVCLKVRKYLEDGTVNGNHRFRKAVERLAVVCFIQDSILYRKHKAILREVCEDYNA